MQYIEDSVRFWQYQPTAEITNIAERATLSDEGRFAFYAAQPTVSSGEAYNAVCNAHKEEHAAILGCYAANRIYLYNVTDPRLEGIKDVTAAHEMLHAIYQRMSDGERERIQSLLDGEFEKLKNEPDYVDRMAYYARTEPGQKYNELHSIIGTEVASMDPELENHYRKYFSDRSKIAELYMKYSSAFTELEDRRNQLSAQLDQLNMEIERDSDSYANAVRLLEADISAFNTKADSPGAFNSVAQFDRERQVLVDRSGRLSSQLTAINAKIVQFNILKDQYNATLSESSDLYKSIDSSLTPAPKV